MSGVIFFETIRRNWRQVLYWGIGISLYGVLMFFIFDSEGLEGYGDLTESLGEEVTRAMGITDLASPEGFLGYAFFGYILLVLAVYMVISGLNVTAVEEENGEMDLLLSLPVPRWKVVLEKVLAYGVLLVGILGIGFLAILLGDEFGQLETGISFSRYLEAMLNIIPGALLILAFTVFAGTLVKRRATAVAMAGVFVVVSYLVDLVANVINTDASDTIGQLSFFRHYGGSDILRTGIDAGPALAIMAIAIALTIGAIGLFTRRDIAV